MLHGVAMSRDIAPFGLRMPTKIRQAVEKSAKANGRSLNAEIVHLLTFALETSSQAGLKATTANLKKHSFILRSLDGKIELELIPK